MPVLWAALAALLLVPAAAAAQSPAAEVRARRTAVAPRQLVPGTVVHLGYGSILDAPPDQGYMPAARALFFKASYLQRF